MATVAARPLRHALWRASTRPAQIFVGLACLGDGLTSEGLHSAGRLACLPGSPAAIGQEDFLSGVLMTLGLLLLAGAARRAPWNDYGLICFVRAITAATWLGMTGLAAVAYPWPHFAVIWGATVATAATWLFVRSDWERPGA